MNLDPDPEFIAKFWTGSRDLEIRSFLLNNLPFINNEVEEKIELEEIFGQLSLWRIYVFNLTPLPLIYPLFTCVDPDPNS